MYYIYENWVAEKKAKIHKADCGFCNNGNGAHNNIHGNRNGKWHGPFGNYTKAHEFAVRLNNRKVSNCSTCLKIYNS